MRETTAVTISTLISTASGAPFVAAIGTMARTTGFSTSTLITLARTRTTTSGLVPLSLKAEKAAWLRLCGEAIQ